MNVCTSCIFSFYFLLAIWDPHLLWYVPRRMLCPSDDNLLVIPVLKTYSCSQPRPGFFQSWPPSGGTLCCIQSGLCNIWCNSSGPVRKRYSTRVLVDNSNCSIRPGTLAFVHSWLPVLSSPACSVAMQLKQVILDCSLWIVVILLYCGFNCIVALYHWCKLLWALHL